MTTVLQKSTDEDIFVKLRKAYFECFEAGFSVSGEGFNAECGATADDIKKKFDRWASETGLDAALNK